MSKIKLVLSAIIFLLSVESYSMQEDALATLYEKAKEEKVRQKKELEALLFFKAFKSASRDNKNYHWEMTRGTTEEELVKLVSLTTGN